MKTIPEIKAEINEIILFCRGEKKQPKREANKHRKKVATLKKCILFLERYSGSDLAIKMEAQCEYNISVYEKRLQEFIDSKGSDKKTPKELKSFYYKNVAPNELVALKSAKEQLSTIQYLLGK